MRAGFDLGVETLNFAVEIVGDRIHSDADGKICCAAESFSGPVGALIQPVQHFDKADGIDFVDSAGFRVVTDRWRITGDGEDISNAADGPGTEQRSLQADDVLV